MLGDVDETVAEKHDDLKEREGTSDSHDGAPEANSLFGWAQFGSEETPCDEEGWKAQRHVKHVALQDLNYRESNSFLQISQVWGSLIVHEHGDDQVR